MNVQLKKIKAQQKYTNYIKYSKSNKLWDKHLFQEKLKLKIILKYFVLFTYRILIIDR